MCSVTHEYIPVRQEFIDQENKLISKGAMSLKDKSGKHIDPKDF